MTGSLRQDRATGERVAASIIHLARRLIRVPSQGGVDSPLPVIEMVGDWLEGRGLKAAVLRGEDGDPAAVVVETGSGGRPRYCLNACLDTAPFGDPGSWSVSPAGADIREGWLFGRGSSDSKVAVAIFAHIAIEMAARGETLDGTLAVLFDADEHTGGFAGVKSYVRENRGLDGVMIGYPGQQAIGAGARGFWRARIRVYGTAEHSGSKNPEPENAIVKASLLVQAIERLDLPREGDEAFSFGPKVTVTEVAGGGGFTTVPDSCAVALDVRLTPSVDATTVERTIRDVCRSVDTAMPTWRTTVLEPTHSWPAYRLPEGSAVLAALRDSAEKVLGRPVAPVISGPSNIGNFLGSMGIETTCGFGVEYRNLHAPDECVLLSSIAPVYEVYLGAVRHLLESQQACHHDHPRR